jgi:hypothetical protein
MRVFWVVGMSTFLEKPTSSISRVEMREDGGRRFLQNTDVYVMVLHHR